MISWFLGIAAASLLAALAAARRFPRPWLACQLLGLAGLLAASLMILSAGEAWDCRPSVALGGEDLHLRLDALSAFFVVLLAFVGAATTVFAHGAWSGERHRRTGRAGRLAWTILTASLGMILLQSNGLHFLIAWEAFALSSYFLITLERGSREVRQAGWLYLAASHAATLCLFAFFARLAVATGGWDLGPWPGRADLAPLFWLALAGFGLKAGLFPLHVWLPSAHAAAPSQVSAMLSGVTIKLAVYGLLRFGGWLPVPEAAAWTILAAGAVSAVLGVAFALAQHDLKRLLAYHSVENIGIIVLGVGFALVGRSHGAPAWAWLALAGGLLHVWNHGLFKSLLFLAAGSMVHAAGTRTMSKLGGLWRTMPWTAASFALGAAAISGLPPLNGFVSEWLIFLGLFQGAVGQGPGAWAVLPGAILLGMTGALALACFVKVCGVVLLGAPRSEAAARAHECGRGMRGAMAALAAGCVAIGLAPAFAFRFAAQAAAAWAPGPPPAPPASLRVLGLWHLGLTAAVLAAAAVLWLRVRRRGLRREVTWDCGYSAPDPRMQYTAGSFAATVTSWFAWILRPVRHGEPARGLFPAPGEHDVHTPDTVLDKVVAPAATAVTAAAAVVRRMQQGRVQTYLLYVVAGAALVVLVAFAGGRG